MKSILIAVLVAFLATDGTIALRCHTCVDFRPWPEFTTGRPSSLCDRGSEPSALYLLPCLSPKQVCGQQFFHADVNGFIYRYAQRGCIDPESVAESGWQVEINDCQASILDLNPILPIGPITTTTCLCDQNACNPILNFTQSATPNSNGNLYKSIFNVDA